MKVKKTEIIGGIICFLLIAGLIWAINSGVVSKKELEATKAELEATKAELEAARGELKSKIRENRIIKVTRQIAFDAIQDDYIDSAKILIEYNEEQYDFFLIYHMRNSEITELNKLLQGKKIKYWGTIPK